MWEPLGTLKKLYLILIALLCGLGLRQLCNWTHTPEIPGYQATILSGGHAISALFCIAAGMILCTLFSSLIARRVRFEAGLYCACLGLITVAIRAGSMGATLRTTTSVSIYRLAALEMLLLFGILMLCWQLLRWLHFRGLLLAEPLNVKLEASNSLSVRMIGLMVHVLIMALVIAALTRTDSLKQTVVSVFVGSLLGSVISHQSFPIRPSCWLWPGAMIVGLAGYIWAMFQHADGSFGVISNPLARPSPLVYASVGTAAAILGYWVSRQWHEAEEDAELDTDLIDEDDDQIEALIGPVK